MKRIFTIILLITLGVLCNKINAQDSLSRAGVTFYINQPLGFINKARFKLGYKTAHKSSYLLCLTSFHSSVPGIFSETKFTGIQFYFEYQHFLNKLKKGEVFFYVKTGAGDYNYSSKESNWMSSTIYENGDGSYVFLGGGFGQELFLNESKTFSIQFNQGLKLCKIVQSSGVNIDDKLITNFYSPGSLIDLNINFGLRF